MSNANDFVIENGVLTKYVGKDLNVVIPEGVTAIRGGAYQGVFGGNRLLQSVVIPESVVEIGDAAFYNCAGLKTVNLPSALETIGDRAFSGCAALESVTIPESVKSIGVYAFSGCGTLEAVALPEGVEGIPTAAFRDCAALKEVQLPQSLKYIESSAFTRCIALEEITIPDGVEKLDGFAFCENLRKVNLPASLKRTRGDAFEGCKKIPFLRVPAGAEAVGPYPKEILILAERAFPELAQVPQSGFCNGSSVLITVGAPGQDGFRLMLNKKFAELQVFDKKGNFSWKLYDNLLAGNECKLPSALQSFAMLCRLRWDQELEDSKRKAYTENLCKNIKKVAPYANLNPEDALVATLETIGALTAKNKKTILPLMGIGEAPAPKKKAEKAAPEGGGKTPAQLKEEWTTKKLEDGSLCLTAYKGTDTVVEVPAMIGRNRVTALGKECMSATAYRANFAQLEQRKKITAVILPEGIEEIGDSAFQLCPMLETVSLPSTLKKIGDSAFARCKQLKNAEVPEGVSVGHLAFTGCPGLADEQGLVIRVGRLFNGYKGGDIVVPDAVTVVDSGFHAVFDDLPELRSVVFPDGVKTLNKVFNNCPALESVTIPPSVTMISYLNSGWKTCRIVGYTGSAAERICKTFAQYQFESVGVLEEKQSEYDIVDGILREYRGDKKTLEHAVIPEGVTSITTFAFRGCEKLARIDFPDTLVSMGGCFGFLGTPWLQQQPMGPVYAGRVLLFYKTNREAQEDVREELVVREGTVEIADSACNNATPLTRVVLPEGLQRIGDGAFSCCQQLEEIVVPASVTEVGDEAFVGCTALKRCTGGVLRRTTKLSAKFKVFYTGDPEDTAWLTLYQQEQSWRKAVRAKLEAAPETIGPAITKMAQLIDAMETLDKGVGNRAGALSQELCKGAGTEALQAIYNALKAKNHPIVKKLDEDDTFKACMEGGAQEDLSKLHPVEAMVVQNLTYSPAFEKLVGRIAEGVRYADSDEVCAERVLAFIAYEYIRQYDPESTKYVSEYAYACTAYAYSEAADAAAAALDQQQLQDALLRLAEQYDGEYWLPYARYADDRHTVSLLSQMRAWDNWTAYAATGRKNIIIARSGLLLNNTRAAMIHMDQVGCLGRYAAIRGTDADTIRDTVLADFGFDENREIRYELGGNTVVIRLDKDLVLTIFDTNAGKTVKSIPKKGAEPQLYEKAKTDFSDLKKNIKKVITNRKKALFADFLSGEQKSAEKWKQSYLDNPVLNSVAQLLVWSQGGRTFTLTAEGAVDSTGGAYDITEEPICVAHPIEMHAEIEAWQNYFTAGGRKQPFEQIWEPAYDPEQIRPERYVGSSLGVYQLANKEQHGITVWGLRDYSEDYGFQLKDCAMEQKASEWRFIHGITDDAVFNLGKFTFKTFTRQVNHIVYLFDKWTAADRIAKDDVSVAESLGAFTAAQIREFLTLANQKGCVNCAALLLDYQNTHFQALDPMAEFTLDL